MPLGTLAPRHLGEERGLPRPSDVMIAQSRPVTAVTAEVHHRRDGSGVQYHATVRLLRAKAPSEAREDRDNLLMAEETMSHPRGNGGRVTRSQNDDMAGGRTGEIHDRGHHSRMTGLIEGGTTTTSRAVAGVAAVMKGMEEHHRPERSTERLPRRRPGSEA